MNRITKRMTSLLSFLLCLLMLVACVPEDAKPTVPPADTPPSQRVEPDVEKKDYNGSFNVLHYTTSNHEWANPWDEIVPASGMENRPGDLIGSGIFDRAAWLEQEYGITLTNEYMEYTQLPTTLQTIHSSGSTEYQLLATMGHSAQVVMGKEYFTNMTDIPGVNFENPWWNKNALETFSFGSYVEFAVSDMLLLDKSAALELMGYYSYYEINNDFYDVVIQNRGTRDEKSKRMLQIIFQTRTYDMGLVYDPYGNTTVAIRIDDPQFNTVNMQWIGLASKREDTVRELRELIKKYN